MFKSDQKGKVTIEFNWKHLGLSVEKHPACLEIILLCFEIKYWFARSELLYSDWHIWDQKLWDKLLQGLDLVTNHIAKVWKIDKKAVRSPSLGGHYSYDPREDKVLFFFDIGFHVDSKDFHVPKKVLQEIEEYKKNEQSST